MDRQIKLLKIIPRQCTAGALSLSIILSGGDETEEEDCCTEDHGSPAHSASPDQSQFTTQEQEIVGEEPEKPEEELRNEAGTSAGEEPAEEENARSTSVDSLMADWQEDLEAFKQMEKDEL